MGREFSMCSAAHDEAFHLKHKPDVNQEVYPFNTLLALFQPVVNR